MIYNFLGFLECLETRKLLIFWLGCFLFYLCLNLNQIESNLKASDDKYDKLVISISYGGALKPDSDSKVVLKNCGKKKSIFPIGLHHTMEERFPDFESRVDFQRQQEKHYQSALKKKNYSASYKGCSITYYRYR